MRQYCLSPGIYSSFREYFERLARGFKEVYPSQPPRNPQATPRQAPMKYNRMMKKETGKMVVLKKLKFDITRNIVSAGIAKNSIIMAG